MANERNRHFAVKEIMQHNLGIRLGIPALSADKAKSYEGLNFEQIALPYIPHIFFVQHLDLWKNGSGYESVNDVMVIIGHGTVSYNGSSESWRFAGINKPVFDLVRSYERYARDLSLPSIDVVLSCRGESPKPTPPGVIVVRPKPPIFVQTHAETPHIFPESVVGQNSTWKKRGEGVENITAEATGWQGVDYWKRWWNENKARRKSISIPQWAKTQSA